MAFDEDPDAALDRHFAAHPEDQDANVVIFDFCDDEELADERQEYRRWPASEDLDERERS